jgi:hypothetical protein
MGGSETVAHRDAAQNQLSEAPMASQQLEQPKVLQTAVKDAAGQSNQTSSTSSCSWEISRPLAQLDQQVVWCLTTPEELGEQVAM